MKTPNLNAVRCTIFLGKVKKEKVPLWLFVSGSSKLSIIFVFTYLQLFVRLLPGKVCVFGFGFFYMCVCSLHMDVLTMDVCYHHQRVGRAKIPYHRPSSWIKISGSKG